MTGAPYNHSQSPPSQQPPYPVYSSSPSKSHHPFYASNDHHQQYPQHPPQTPPTFSHTPAPANLSASPHYAHATPSMPSTLPPLNGAEQPAPGGIQYHGVHSSASGSAPAPAPPYSLPRPYSASVMPGNGASPPYAHSTPSHSHQSRPNDPASATQSPPRRDADPAFSRMGNGAPGVSILQDPPPPPSPKEEAKPARAADPMSFASILSGPTDDAPKKSSPPPAAPSEQQQQPPAAAPASPTPASLAPVEHRPKEPEPSEPVSTPTRAPAQATPKVEEKEKQPPKERRRNRRTTTEQEPPVGEFPPPAVPNGAATADSLKKPASSSRPPQPSGRTLSERDIEVLNKITAEIENEDKSDVDAPGFEAELERYMSKGRKRALNTERSESIRRKRRRQDFLVKLGKSFEKQAVSGSERFKIAHEPAVISEVQAKEVQDEKERKKDMQRKRRRENTIRLETQRFLNAELKAHEVPDAVVKAKYLREAERAQRKINSTKRALEGATAPEEISEVTPLAPNLEGGTTSSFHIGRNSPSRRKSGRAGATSASRPKKSKEQKQAEKDAAEAAYAAMENDEPLSSSMMLDDPRKELLKKEGKEGTPISVAATPTYDSKGYNQIYEQIWRDIARKDIPKVYRIKGLSLGIRQENLRKTAQLASKQSRKWQERTNKSTKDTQARAKRTMREMITFWKRNEREERDLRRLAEKQEIESAKKAEADREANRQRRKLNFLISQTELYSHFIGRKIKGTEADEAGDTAVDGSNETVKPGKPQDHTVNLPPSAANPNAKVTNFEDLDFDAEDETTLQQAAMANAQNAVQEAQDRARAFNNAADDQEENKMAAFDEGELNFQNPTSLGDIEISQPTMLTTQLKEYQLKGLNWLVNLYEQGINGILADEMGLGKTIQSISVMAYLAEYHNIWGPFLVIAPASTLHNWQQEITKFVPNIKVLPYWGTSKDRKILRKFWDRKHITYTRDSEFHVLVTSYQLVVLDAQYFQKVKWQYMILDEAQAIKSSQSSRWKNLLGFHCRNRLLLTGTPIQNNMQELWALLHFIMPTLFDSHDEFSEWFSKDIESHAQSNTKLNEDQLRRLHMILKPFMLRRVKKHVQQELGDKVEKDIFCDLTYRQRAYYANLRNRVSIMDLIERAAVGDEADSTTLMNLVMQFRKVCNHPDLFERAETKSPFSLAHFAETASFVREGPNVDFVYSTRNRIEYNLPRFLCGSAGRIDMAGPDNMKAGFRNKYLGHLMNIWAPENIQRSAKENGAFSFLRFVDTSPGEANEISRLGVFERAYRRHGMTTDRLARINAAYDKEEDGDDVNSVLSHSMLNIVERNGRGGGAAAVENVDKEEGSSILQELMTVSRSTFEREGLSVIEPCASPAVSAPFIPISASTQGIYTEMKNHFFNVPVRHALFDRPTTRMDEQILEQKIDPSPYNRTLPPLLPKPISQKGRYTHIEVPSMHRFVTDSGKLAKLDELLRELKAGGHRVLLYFQMTRMIDLMEEYLTYRNYKYCRLDGSTKLEDRRDTVADFQQRPEIFVFLLSTRAGGLGINLTAADTVIFYDSDWNPTIDSQAMDRAHRLGQTRQVTVYRLITRNTIEERIRKRALQKEEVQRVVITGGAAGGVDFNTRNRESRTKDIAMWLADDEQIEQIEQREKEALDRGEVFGGPAKGGKKAAQQQKKKKKDLTLDDMYHEGEGNFDDANAAKQSGAATPLSGGGGDVGTPSSTPVPKRGRGGGAAAAAAAAGGGRGGSTKGTSKRAKTTKERLRLIDGDGGLS